MIASGAQDGGHNNRQAQKIEISLSFQLPSTNRLISEF